MSLDMAGQPCQYGALYHEHRRFSIRMSRKAVFEAARRVPAKAAAAPENRWAVPGVCLFLALAAWVVFGQTARFEFVNFDDDAYVYENPVVKGGLTRNGIVWAFNHRHAGNWHPLTTLSHELDCQWYGLKAGEHHLTNVALHAAAAILLFLALRQMTGALWRSAFVAALFAVHPLRAESVAWVAERKDVLSGLFFMLTLAAYVRYVRQPGSWVRYLTVVLLFALGLMSKPMLVTLPFVLLLLDYWPLRRFQLSTLGSQRSTLFEKIPLLVLSAAACVVTLVVQSKALQTTRALPFRERVGNALVSYAAYLGQSVFPVRLAAFYPGGSWTLGEITLAVAVLAAISAAAFVWRRNRPYFLVGWLWYLGMLVPVIGLVQVGLQARADRYTYLPQIGLWILLTWTVVELSAVWRHRRRVLALGAAVILAALIACARAQTGHWRDSQSLWLHTLSCTTSNALAESNLGNAFLHQGQLDEAIAHCRQALEIEPDYGDAQNCLGFALFQRGQANEAIAHLEQAVRLQPSSAAAQNNLGITLLQLGRTDHAIAHFQSALSADPDLADAHGNLGVALLRKGQAEAAVAQYQKALELKPDYVGACNNLAWVLATFPDASVRNGARAVELAQRANQLSGAGNLVILRTLAAAFAEAGQFPQAIQTAGQALQLAVAQANSAWADRLRSEIKLYQAGNPLREDPQQAASAR